MGKKAKKDNGVHVIDTTKDAEKPEDAAATAKAALAALSPEQRAVVLKELGIKSRQKKDKGPDPRELFKVAREKLYSEMPAIQGIVNGCTFPTAFAFTVGVDSNGFFCANLKRIRTPYGPRNAS